MTSSRPAIWFAALAMFLFLGLGSATTYGQDGPAAHVHGESADDGHHASGGHAEGGHDHAATVRREPHGKFGQLPEFLYVDPILIGWTFALFTVLAFLLRHLAWKPILETIHKREQAFAESQRAAITARDEAKQLIAEHQKEMGKAHEEAKALLEKSREEAARECEQLIANARVQAAQAHEKAEAEIETAKEQALAEVKQSALGLASEIAGKVSGKDLRGGDYGHLLEESTR